MTARIRYLAQRFGSNAWLDFDVPFTTDGPIDSFSTYETLTATIAPERARRLADDGRPIIEKWGTWIHAETPDERVWTGIVVDCVGDGAQLTVKMIEWHGFLHGLTFKGKLWGVKSDPADLVRSLVSQVQALPGGNLGIEVVGATPVRLGTDLDDELIVAQTAMAAAKAALDAKAKPRKALEAEIKKISVPFDKEIRVLDYDRKLLTRAYDEKVKAKAPASQVAAAKAAVDAKDAQLKAKRVQKDAAIGNRKDTLEDLKFWEEPLQEAFDAKKDAADVAKQRVQDEGGAWKALPEDLPDCWKLLQQLADEAPFEFTMSSVKTNGAPKLRLQIHYPACGRVRTDLVFEQGRNIIGQPQVRVPEEYASEVIAVGAGEASDPDKALRAEVAVSDPRIYRNTVLSDPSVTSAAVLNKRGRAELDRLRASVLVPEIVVRDDVNCPIGAWSAGDTIVVKLHSVPHFGSVTVKHRVRSWQRFGTHQAKLRLEAVSG